MAVSDVIRAATASTRDHGFTAGLLTVSVWARRVKELDLVALTDPRAPKRALEASDGHTFRFASDRDLIEVGRQFPEQYAHVDLEYLQRGDRCLLQFDGEELTGFAWIAGSPLVYLDEGYHINLPDQMVYNYHAFTAPAYRGFGFQALRHWKLLELLRPEGKTALFGFVDRLNFPSQKGVVKSGYRRVGRLTLRNWRGTTMQKLVIDQDFVSTERRN